MMADTGRAVGFGVAMIALSAALAACTQTQDNFRARSTAPTQVYAATSDTFLQITAQGAVPITAATPFSSKSITAGMPGYTTGHVTIGLETSTPDAFRFSTCSARAGASPRSTA